MKKLFFASPKAGVGKTTAAINMAAAAALSGRRVLLVDCDPLGDSIAALGLGSPHATLEALGVSSPAPLWRDAVPGLDVTSPYGSSDQPAHTLDEFLALLENEWGFRQYELVLIDTPPVLASSQVSVLLRACDEVVLVVRAKSTALREVHPFLQVVKRLQDEGTPIHFRGLLLTLPPGEPLNGAWESELRRAFAASILPHAIPFEEEVQQASAQGKLILTTNPNSLASRQYSALAQRLGLIENEGEAVNLFPTPLPFDPAGSSRTPEEIRELLGESVHAVAESLSQVTKVTPELPHDGPANRSEDETRNMNDPNSTGLHDGPIRGHTGDVTAVTYSPTDRLMATASWDKTIRLWDSTTGAEKATLAGHAGVVSSVAFSPDGSLLASTSWDKTARLWKVATGSPAVAFKGHAGVVTSVAFSPRGDRLATGGWDKVVRVWKLDGEPVSVLVGHVRMVTSVAIAPEGRVIASGSWDRTIKLWNLETGVCTGTLLGHAGDVMSVAFSPDGKLIASGSLDHTIRFWDAHSAREINVLRGHGGEVTSVSFSPDGRRLASAGWDRTLKIWDVATGQLLNTLNGHGGVVTCVTFSPDGQRIASSSLDRTIKVWEVESGHEAATLRVQSSNEAKAEGPYNPRETPPPRGSNADDTKIGMVPPPPVSQPIPPRREVVAPPPPTPTIVAPPPPTPAIVAAPPSTPEVEVAPAPHIPRIRLAPLSLPAEASAGAAVTPPVPSKPIPVPAPPPPVAPPAPRSVVQAPLPPFPKPPAPKAPLPPVVVSAPQSPRITVPNSPIIPRPVQPTPSALATSQDDDSFVDTWSPPASSPLLSDILGPSLGSFMFGAAPVAQSAKLPTPNVTASEIRPVDPISSPMVSLAPTPTAVPSTTKKLHFGDLRSVANPVPSEEAISESEDDSDGIEIAIPTIQLPEVAAIAPAAPSSLRFTNLTSRDVPEPVELETPEEAIAPQIDEGEGIEVDLPTMEFPDVAIAEFVTSTPDEELPIAENVEENEDDGVTVMELTLTDGSGPVSGEEVVITLPPILVRPSSPSDSLIPEVVLPSISISEAVVMYEGTPAICIPTAEQIVESVLDAGQPADATVAPPFAESVKAPETPKLSLADLAEPLNPIIEEPARVLETLPHIVIPDTSKLESREPAVAAEVPGVRRPSERPARGSTFNALAVSPDGNLVAATRGDSSVMVWYASTGEMIQSLQGHTGEVTALAFSPDSAVLATAGVDRTVRLWEVADGSEYRVLTGHHVHITAVAFSMDDLHLATAGLDGTITIWDWVDGRNVATLSGHRDGVTALAYSPDGFDLLSGGEDGTVRLWDLETKQGRLTIPGHKTEVTSVAYGPDGERVASAGGDGFTKIWDAGTGEQWLAIAAHTGACSAVAFGSEGDLLATAGRDHAIRVWNANNGHPLQHLSGHQADVTGLAFMSDGKTLISAGWDRSIRFWDPFSGAETATLTEQGFVPRSSVRITPPRLSRPDERAARPSPLPPRVVATPVQATPIPAPPPPAPRFTSPSITEQVPVTIADPEPTVQVPVVPIRTSIEVPSVAQYISSTSDQYVLITSGGDASVRIWSPSTRTELKALQGHTREITCVAASTDGRWILTGSDDETVRLWDPIHGTERFRFIGHGGEITAVAFSPDGRTLASSSSDMTVRLWDIVSGKEKATLVGHRVEVLALMFSSDGKLLATGGRDGTVKVWDATSRAEKLSLRGHSKLVKAIAFSPDNRQLLSGSWDWSARVWDLATGNCVHTLSGHGSAISAVAYLPSGHGVITASWDKTARLWTLAGGQTVRVLEGHADRLSSVAVSPDSQLAVTGSWDGTVGMWELSSGQNRTELRSPAGRVQAVTLATMPK